MENKKLSFILIQPLFLKDINIFGMINFKADLDSLNYVFFTPNISQVNLLRFDKLYIYLYNNNNDYLYYTYYNSFIV